MQPYINYASKKNSINTYSESQEMCQNLYSTLRSLLQIEDLIKESTNPSNQEGNQQQQNPLIAKPLEFQKTLKNFNHAFTHERQVADEEKEEREQERVVQNQPKTSSRKKKKIPHGYKVK